PALPERELRIWPSSPGTKPNDSKTPPVTAAVSGSRFRTFANPFRPAPPVPPAPARGLALAGEFVDRERFFVGWGDIVVGPENYANVVSAAARARAVLAANHVDAPASGGAVYVDEAMRVTRLVEKPPPGASATSWNNAGLM